jgi:hypothetical protein
MGLNAKVSAAIAASNLPRLLAINSEYTPIIPTIVNVRVENRRALKEKPVGIQKIAPHSDCVISDIPVKPVGRQSPRSTRLLTGWAEDQSSLSGKLPRGFTIRILTM